MFKVLVNKKNDSFLKRIIIPKSEGYNQSTWIMITIKGKEEFLLQRFEKEIEVDMNEWEWKINYGYPAALMNEFLRLDFEGEEMTTTNFDI